MDLLQDEARALELIDLQIWLEYQVDQHGRLVPFAGSEEQARYITYRHAGGYANWYRHDLPESVVARLAGAPAAWGFEQPGRILEILDGAAQQQDAEAQCYISAFLPRQPDPAEFLGVERSEQGSFVIHQGGQRVAWAYSVRENDHCAELAVETLPAFRRRGYARQVTAAWAHQVIERGRYALYSYKANNLASAALANSLGAIRYAEVVGYD